MSSIVLGMNLMTFIFPRITGLFISQIVLYSGPTQKAKRGSVVPKQPNLRQEFKTVIVN